jgi:Tfp pilus assembly protein PilF
VTYLAGGYALLAWLGAVACAGTVALLLRRDNILSLALAIVAVPLIANRTQPRAEMFTTILFAAFLSVLWRHYANGNQNGRRSPLWLLPILMVGWVNLHPGFIAGLALCAAYVGLEVLELPFPEYRAAALARLKRAWPWLALTGVATLVNPWGARIYSAVGSQARAQSLHTSWVVEWGNVRPSWASLQQALDWRDPQSSFWWLLLIAVVCAAVALWRRRWGAAILLLGSGYLTIQHVRLQALFACVAVVVGGSILQEAWKSAPGDISKRRILKNTEWAHPGVLVLTAVLIALVGVRGFDLIGNRYYLRPAQLSLFGSGLSGWFPERAVDFIEREKLPANIFNNYTLGGYLTWRLSPNYPDYIDGRALPFGPQLFFRAYDLSVEPPDSPAWQQEADTGGINTVLVSLARYEGIALFPQLPAFCHSQSWRPVYMDEVSAVFLRRTPETSSLIDRLQIDCDKSSFAPLTYLGPFASMRDRAEQFNSWANAAGILYSLGRYPEALAYLDHAQTIFADNANLHLTRALVLEHTGRAKEADAEFRTSLHLEPSDEAWFDLGLFYMTQKRYAEAAEVFRRSAESSARPHDMWMLLGQAELQMNQPQAALEAFDKAEASSPFREGGESLGAGFNSLIATGRAKAWYQLGDLAKAVSFQEEAVRLAPAEAKLWLGLGDLYEAQGRSTKAAEARSQAAGH